MSAASKFFRGVLGSNSEDGKPTEFLWDDFDAETIKSVVNFCYTGNIELTEKNAEQILKIASSGEFDLLESKCRQFYAERLNATNVVTVLIVADKYRAADLQKKALDLICDEFDKVASADFRKLDPARLCDLLKRDEMRRFDDLCAKRLLEWFHYDEDDRGVSMPKLLRLIRLEQLSTEVNIDQT